MKVGDLIRMRATGSIWVVVAIPAGPLLDTILAQNVKTQVRNWMNPAAFEVL